MGVDVVRATLLGPVVPEYAADPIIKMSIPDSVLKEVDDTL